MFCPFAMAPWLSCCNIISFLPCHLCCNNAMALSWNYYNTSEMANAMALLQHKCHGKTWELCCSIRAKHGKWGTKTICLMCPKWGTNWALILGTESILKSIEIIYSTSFLVKYMYSKWGTKTLYPKWGTHLGYNIGCSNEFNI